MAYAQQPRYGPPGNYYEASGQAPMSSSQGYPQDGYGYGPPAQQQAYGPGDGYNNGHSDGRQGQYRSRPSPRQAQQQFQPRQQGMGGSHGNWQGEGYDNDGGGHAANGGWSQPSQDPYNQQYGYGDDPRHMQGGYSAQGPNQGYQKTAYGQQGGRNGYQEQHQGPRNNYQRSPQSRPAAPQRSYSAGPGADVPQQTIPVNHQPGQPQMPIHPGKPRPAQHPNQAAPPKKKEKERILNTLESPESLAWDNPFPSFPGIEEKKHAVKADSSRPQTAAGERRSHETTRSLGRDPNVAGGPHFDQGRSNQHLGPQHQPSQPMQPAKENRMLQAPPPQQRSNGDRGVRQAPHVDGYSDQHGGALSPPQPSFTAREQRSNTLPNEVSENMLQGNFLTKPQDGGQRAVTNLQRQNPLQQASNAYRSQQNGPQQRHHRPNSYDAGLGHPQAASQVPSNRTVQNDYPGRPDKNARRPSASSQRSKPQQGHPRSNTPGHAESYKQKFARSQPTLHQAPVISQGSSADVVDEYSEEPEPAKFKPYKSLPESAAPVAEDEEDMPNFDAALSSPTHDKALHIEPQKEKSNPSHPDGSSRGRQAERTPTEGFAGQAHRSRSQPDLRSPASPNDFTGFDFGIGKGQPQMPPMNPKYTQQRPNQPYQNSLQNPPYQGEWQQPSNGPFSPPERSYTDGFGPGPRQRNDSGPGPGSQSYGGGNVMQQWPGPGPQLGSGARSSPGPGAVGRPPLRSGQPALNTSRTVSDGSQRQGGSQMSSPNLTSVASPTSSRPLNPDALPHHPAPVRTGHMQQTQSPPMNQQNLSRPPPVRQYNGSSPGAQASIAPPPAQPMTAPVTYEELQRLRGIVQSRPNDQATQLVLAKKLVEAASTLPDEGGRADPRTKAKNRERYIMEAHKMIKKLVGVGNVEAMFFLADCYGSGQLGLQKDQKEAFQLYQSAAKLNHPQSAYRVAVCCEIGLEDGGGTRRDPVKAMQWYQRAATLGDVPAMYKLGVIQLKGLLGQSRNAREAVNWLQKAAEHADDENPHALHELGLLYQNSLPNDGIARDENHARHYFSQAAELGYKFSQFKLGQAYEQGSMGFQQNPKMSIAWYSKAAMQEEHQSELGLSGWYLTGAEGVLQQNDTEAYLWARKAAQAGLAKAEYAMGYFTEVGIGSPADLEAAKRWYWKAASQNFPKARERLEDLRRGGTRIQKTRVSRSAINKSEGDCKVM